MKLFQFLSIAALACGLPALSRAGAPVKAEAASTTTSVEKPAPLSGVQLWTINCNRCHMFRSSGEFTAAQWQPIMLHMRVRANIPAAQAREILKFLQSGAGK